MSILNRIFGKRRVIGLEIFAGWTEVGAAFAAPGKKLLVFRDAGDLDKLVASTDRDLNLDGELVTFYRTHFSPDHVAVSDRHLTDAEWTSFLREKFSGKQWKYCRYQGLATEYLAVVVFG